MIAKHMPMRLLAKGNFSELISYLLDPQSKTERVGQVTMTNCQSDAVEVATLEVLNTQAMNQRTSADKTYHLMLSFRAGEQPDAKTLQMLEREVCAALGFAEHQRISVVHHDTDNLHVHIAINKIHPVRHTVHTPYNDYRTLARICEKLEKEYGLANDNHTPSKRCAEDQACDMEQHAGVESLIGWIKRECWDELRAAGTWEQLHQSLRDNGLRLHLRANGLAITAADGTTIKASSLDRQFSKSQLEARLGEFVPGQNGDAAQDAKHQYQRKAMRCEVDTSELYVRYLAEKGNVAQLRAAAWSDAGQDKRRQISEAKAKGRLKRAVVKALSCDKWSKRLLYAAIGRTLLADIHQINKAHFAERQRIYQQYRRQTWADWLQKQAAHGNDDALAALRGRKGRDCLRGNTLSGQRTAGKGRDVGVDSITKHGTVIICAGTTVLRDDGDKLAVTKGFNQQGLQTALSMAIERYGACIRVEGTAEFREQIVRAAASGGLNITFDDAALERRRHELLQINAEKENKHDFTSTGKRRSAGSSDGGNRSAATRSEAPASTGYGKPNVGAVGKQPPPASQHRLRTMRQLGLVRIPGGSAVLLPGDVPGHLELQRPAANHGMRRDVSGTGLSAARAPKRAPRRRPGQRGPTLSKLAALSMSAPGKARFAKRQSAPPASQRVRQLSDLAGLSMSAPGKARSVKRQSGPQVNQHARQLTDLARLAMSGRGTDAMQQPSRTRGNRLEPVPGGQASPKVKGRDAVQQYVFERQQMKRTFFGIPKHLAYDGFQGPATFGGLRKVGGEKLALLQRGDEIFVLAIDEPTAQRLKHLARGTTLTVGRQGVIKKKGRSR